MPQRLASSSTAWRAWRLVPTKRMSLPRATVCCDESLGAQQTFDGLFHIDDVNHVALAVDVRLHLRIPPRDAMAEVDACVHEAFDEFCLIRCHDLSTDGTATTFTKISRRQPIATRRPSRRCQPIGLWVTRLLQQKSPDFDPNSLQVGRGSDGRPWRAEPKSLAETRKGRKMGAKI